MLFSSKLIEDLNKNTARRSNGKLQKVKYLFVPPVNTQHQLPYNMTFCLLIDD